jgi:peptidoglycan/LPS O-acetylase OafA/YrhL
LRLTSPLRWLGRHSYELYLFHIVILALMRNVYARGELQPLGWAFWFAFFVILSGMLAHLVAQYISEPANLAIRTRYLNWFDRKALPAKANSLIG